MPVQISYFVSIPSQDIIMKIFHYMFSLCGPIGVVKVPTNLLLLKRLRVGQDVSKHFEPQGLAQLVEPSAQDMLLMGRS